MDVPAGQGPHQNNRQAQPAGEPDNLECKRGFQALGVTKPCHRATVEGAAAQVDPNFRDRITPRLVHRMPACLRAPTGAGAHHCALWPASAPHVGKAYGPKWLLPPPCRHGVPEAEALSSAASWLALAKTTVILSSPPPSRARLTSASQAA